MPVIKVDGGDVESLTKLAAKTCFFSGFNVQSFSFKSTGYIKFDKKPVMSRQEEFSDYLLIADRLADIKSSLRSAKEKSVVVLNAREKPKFPEIKKRKLRVYFIDAESVAQNIAKPLATEAIMLGALVKFCDKITSRAGRSAIGENKELHNVFEEGFRTAK
jgi:Pyruvate/2-oxoacid:ferredoxin oxidoreductase gamma subunit